MLVWVFRGREHRGRCWLHSVPIFSPCPSLRDNTGGREQDREASLLCHLCHRECRASPGCIVRVEQAYGLPHSSLYSSTRMTARKG